MVALTKTEFDRVLDALKAAGEETRLRLLRLLAHEELSVMELVSILDQSQPRISRHLKLMNEAGLIERFPDGAWVFYRLSQAAATRPLIDAILDRLDDSYAADMARLDEVRRQRRSSAEAYFETIAPMWDEIRSHHGSEAEIESLIVALAGSQPYEQLVDLGTGSGRMLTLLARKAKTAIGIDLSQHMLNVARNHVHDEGLRNIEFRHGDIYDTRLPAASADLVVIHQVLHFLSDPARAIVEAGRIVRSGGRVLIADFAPHNIELMREKYQHRRLGLADDDMVGWLQAAGFKAGGSVLHGKPATPGGLAVDLYCFTRA
jgi:ArsR family transcriptional regulator